MDRRSNKYYGTPLSKVLDTEQNEARPDGLGTARSRRLNRFNKQQTVTDDQGRKRFHGAFTGGFSAGYFNTVSSVEGFKPKQFVTHRGGRKDGEESSSFNHRPEDYMDEEDLGEFGIAPRKLRPLAQYANDTDPFSRLDDGKGKISSRIDPINQSIGAKILDYMENAHNENRRIQYNLSEKSETNQVHYKTDYHCLGYKPLSSSQESSKLSKSSSSKPLIATLGGGKRLKITGEAFGSGVLNDEEDYYDDNGDAFGYDDIHDYQFGSNKAKTRTTSNETQSTTQNYIENDPDLIPGFVLSCQSVDSISTSHTQYKLPEIPRDWIMPVRSKLEVSIPSSSSTVEDESKGNKTNLSMLNQKFVAAASSLQSEDIGTKVGFVPFSDLKASETELDQNIRSETRSEDDPRLEITIERQVFEWRPCSLLCKRFNVPNPFPDNSFFGTKLPSDSKSGSNVSPGDSNLIIPENNILLKLAPLDLKRSIYNVTFKTDKMETSKGNDLVSAESNGEYEPQIVDIEETKKIPRHRRCEAKGDEEIEIIPTDKKEPELIVLSSGSSDVSYRDDDMQTERHSDKPSNVTQSPNEIHCQPSSSNVVRKKKKKKKKKKKDKPSKEWYLFNKNLLI